MKTRFGMVVATCSLILWEMASAFATGPTKGDAGPLLGRQIEPVPTLSEAGMLLMVIGLGAVATWKLRQRKART